MVAAPAASPRESVPIAACLNVPTATCLQSVTMLKKLDPRDPVRIEKTDELLEKLWGLGLIQTKQRAPVHRGRESSARESRACAVVCAGECARRCDRRSLPSLWRKRRVLSHAGAAPRGGSQRRLLEAAAWLQSQRTEAPVCRSSSVQKLSRQCAEARHLPFFMGEDRAHAKTKALSPAGASLPATSSPPQLCAGGGCRSC